MSRRVALASSVIAVLVSGCPETHVPSSCVSSRECSAASLVCDTTRGICVECNTDEDCLFTDRACRDHACVAVTPCTSSVMCPGLVCDTTLGFCVECVTDTDCPGDEVCDDSVCEAPPTPCTSDRMCSAMGEVCDLTVGLCVRCVRDADCGAGSICVDRDCRFVGVDAGRPDAGVRDAGMPPATEELDLLLMVDNSNSMVDEQALLASELPRLVQTLVTGDRDGDGVADFTPVGSLHVGIITPDMGAGPFLPAGETVPTCEAGFGDDGILRTSGRVTAGCASSFPPIFAFTAGSGDPAAFADEVACVAVTGTGGCGFEQQLEATLKALSPAAAAPFVPPDYLPPVFVGSTSGHADGANAGFLRAGSVLAVLLVTDEEDCSVPDYSLFYRDPRFESATLNLRCFTFPSELFPISRYVDGLLALRAFPSRLVYGAIAGVPTDLVGSDGPSYDTMLADPRLVERADPANDPPIQLLPSCSTADGGRAFAPRRMIGVARSLDAAGAHTTVQSICAANFVTATDAFVDEMAAALSGR